MPFKYKLSRRLALLRAPTIALAASLTLGCTGLLDTDPEEEIQISISPQSLVLEPNAEALFSVAATSANDDADAIEFKTTLGRSYADVSSGLALEWAATGGTIANDGRYRAAAEPGEYRVVVFTALGGVADTAHVTVTAAPASLLAIDLTPDSASVADGASAQFSVTGLTNAGSVPVAVSFSTTGGSIDAGGLYTATEGPGLYLVVARHESDAGAFADTARVSVAAAPVSLVAIDLTPDSASVAVGGSAQFSVTGQTSDGTRAPVAVEYGTTGGAIDATGLYTAPAGPGLYLVVARHESAAGAFADTARVSVTAAPPSLVGVDLTPDSTAVSAGAVVQFSVTGELDSGEGVVVAATFSATGGSVDAAGVYTAPGAAGTYRVMARHESAAGVFGDTSVVVVLPAPPAGDQIALEGTSGHNGRNDATMSWSHQIGGGADRMLVVGLAVENVGDVSVASVTYAGVPLTHAETAAASSGGTVQHVELWYLLEAQLPSAGAHDVTIVTASPVEELNVGAVSLANVAQRAPDATAAGRVSGTSEIATEIITRNDNVWLIDAVGSGSGGGGWSPAGGQTMRWNESAGNASAAGSTRPVPSATTVSMRHTYSGVSNRSAHVVMAVAPAGTSPPPPAVASVQVSPATVSLALGEERQFAATTRGVDGAVLTGRSVTWSSSNPAVASVDQTGLVTAVGAGLTTVVATSEGKEGTASVGVAADPTAVASVVITPPSASLWVGDTRQFSAEPKNAAGLPLSGHTVTWSSDDPSVATVTADGLVTAVAAGTATVTAAVSGVEAYARIGVRIPGQEPDAWFAEDFSRYTSDANFKSYQFDDGNPRDATALVYWDVHNKNNADYFLDQSADAWNPHTGTTQALKTVYYANWFEGNADYERDVKVNMWFPDHDSWPTEMWVEIWHKFDENYHIDWGQGGSQGQKWLFFLTESRQHKWSSNLGEFYGGDIRYKAEIGYNPDSQEGNQTSNSHGITRGKWYRYRAHVKIGTTSTFEVWIEDPDNIGTFSKIHWPGKGDVHDETGDPTRFGGRFAGLTLGSNLNGRMSSTPRNDVILWRGPIKVYTTDPGWDP